MGDTVSSLCKLGLPLKRAACWNTSLFCLQVLCSAPSQNTLVDSQVAPLLADVYNTATSDFCVLQGSGSSSSSKPSAYTLFGSDASPEQNDKVVCKHISAAGFGDALAAAGDLSLSHSDLKASDAAAAYVQSMIQASERYLPAFGHDPIADDLSQMIFGQDTHHAFYNLVPALVDADGLSESDAIMRGMHMILDDVDACKRKTSKALALVLQNSAVDRANTLSACREASQALVTQLLIWRAYGAACGHWSATAIHDAQWQEVVDELDIWF